MTPQQLQELRHALPKLADSAAALPQLQEFCRFYDIDFSQAYPRFEHVAGTVVSGAHTLAVHRWSCPGASSNLLLLHGYFDHTGLFGKLIDYGLSRNCNVLIFDLPGHGLSSGDTAVIDEFSDYSRAIADVLAAAALPDLPLWVMAQSTGCAALVDFARQEPWPFSAAVLLAPLVRPVSWMRVRVAHMLLQHFVDTVPREFTRNSSDREFLAFIQRDPLQSQAVSVRWVGALRRWLKGLPLQNLWVGPVLVIQGDEDKTVAWRYNLKVITKLFPGTEVEYLAGGGHQLANESAAMRERYLSRVASYVAARGVALDAQPTDTAPPP